MEDPALDRLKSEARGVQGEAAALANQMGRTPDPMAPLVEYAVDKAAAGLGAAVTETLFGVRMPGSRVGRAWVQRQRALARRSQEAARKQQAVGLAARLEAAVRTLPDPGGRRFKRSILNELREAMKTQRAATVVRRIMIAAERIADYEPQPPPVRPGLEYTELRDLEQCLRVTIVDLLSKISESWWRDRIPEDVRANAERRLREHASPWP